MFDLIPIVSINHTGSHSVGERFSEQLPDYNYLQGNKLKKLKIQLKYSGRCYENCSLIDGNRGNIIRGIIGPEIIKYMIGLSKEYRLVIPMRDPLLALISDSDWYSASHHILLGLFLWAEYLFDLKPFHVPVDLDTSELTYKGVNFKDLHVAHKTEDSFTFDELKSSDLRKAYYSKDDKFLFDNLPDFKMLCTIEPILRPKLEELGYRDLLWWDTPYAVKNVTTFDIIEKGLRQKGLNYNVLSEEEYDTWLKHHRPLLRGDR